MLRLFSPESLAFLTESMSNRFVFYIVGTDKRKPSAGVLKTL
jgi:hypothetical protein